MYRTFDSVLIKPRYSEILSRSNVDLSGFLSNIYLKLPIISSNMKTVTGPSMVKAMYQAGGLGILHRFCSIEENVSSFRECFETIPTSHIGVSVGVTEYEHERCLALLKAGARLFCVDVAHGDHILVRNMIRYIRENQPEKVTIIAGNVATSEGALHLYEWGADIVKLGIGPGVACQTRRNTGVGVPQLSVIESVKWEYPQIPIIADGGCRTGRHITTALAAGADAVMLGAILAGTTETPGNVYPEDTEDLVNRTYYKMYGGSASAQNKGENRFVEGKMMKIPFKGHVKYILREIKESIQSACSYVGVDNLRDFRKAAELIDIDQSGNIESST
jgi:IMP dehydrogenase